MQRVRAFFYVSLGILALVVAFHFGAGSAHSQSSGVVAAAFQGTSSPCTVISQNGDILEVSFGAGYIVVQNRGNVFTGSTPIPATRTTLGRVKAQYR